MHFENLNHNFFLRPLKKIYVNEVMAIEDSSFTNPWSRSLFMHEISNSISRNFTVWLTSFDRQILAGYTMCWLVADEMQIHKIAVKPEFRRLGLATFLLKSLFNKACDEGCQSVTLEVRSTNKAAINLYEKLGFVVKGIRSSYYSEQNEDALIMEMDLTFTGSPTL
jgi:ribosomal-protein-alanine N-acetyltransferase